MDNNMLEIINLYAGYQPGKFVLQDFSLILSEGERIGIVGQNGCGKSTLAKTIMGLVPYTKGRILWQGEDLLRSNADKRAQQHIACFLQGGKVFGNLTVKENIQFALLNTKNTYRQAMEQLNGYEMELFDDKKRLNLLAANLSGGEKHLLSFAMTTLSCPNAKLLIADEPSAGVAITTQNKLLKIINNYLSTRQTALIMIEHNINFLQQLTEKTIEIKITE